MATMLLSRGRLTAAIMSLAAVTAVGAASSDPNSSPIDDANAAQAASQETQSYIIGFHEAPLATYRGEIAELKAPPRKGEGRGRVDVASKEARDYVKALQGRQRGHEQAIASQLGREPQVTARMQHVFNGIVAELTPAEAAALDASSDVALVEEYREYQIDTDVGPYHIGADSVWLKGSGLPPGQISGPGFRATPWNAAAQGEGVIFGIIDSGINFGSPSFSAVDMDGYTHTNPNGAGNYLGTCAPGGVDEGRCNDKLIGGYDFVCGAPGNTCIAANREEPGFGDTNGHGSHTASTAAGNRRRANYFGVDVEISGVAPRANVIAYDACYTRLSDGQGLCPNVSTLASVNQAIADGVDVINYSIGGGSQPWSESVSLAFLNATDAGIFVSASAGNSGPTAATLGHVEPWTATVAAAQHGRGDYSFVLKPDPASNPPAGVAAIPLTLGTNGVGFPAGIPAGTPLVVSAGIDSANDACDPLPANTFQGAIAVVRRGTCSFAIKVNTASAAGAVAVIIANNQAGTLTASVPGTTVPAFSMLQTDSNALRDFAAGKPNLTAAIPHLPEPQSNVIDALGAFSSRGPSGFDLLKPDVAAPGVRILAADAGTTINGFEQLVGLKNGTSMSAPHNAGAAGLLRQLFPSWTPAEIKSALMMTAYTGVLKEDGVTPANPWDTGSGRIQIDRAARAGLVMDESKANYLAANPATGGNPSALNLPSMANAKCINGCSFVRSFRNTRANAQTWTARIEGLKGTVSPASFSMKGFGTQSLKVDVDSTNLVANGGWNFGTLVLTPNGNTGSPTLRLPIGIAVPPPSISLSASQVDLTLAAGQNGSANVTVTNIGGPMLNYQRDTTATAPRIVAQSARGTSTSGFRSTKYTDGNSLVGQYTSDDFTLNDSMTLTRLFAEGFFQGSGLTATTRVTWSIFADAGGKPAGNPQTSLGSALWTHSAAITGAGVTFQANVIALDLVAANRLVTLAPGTYWLVVHTDAAFANRWAWYATTPGAGGFNAQSVQPSVTTNWAPNASPGLAFQVDGRVSCAAPSWIASVVPSAGSLDFQQSDVVGVNVNTAGLAPGNYAGFVCLASNDPATPLATVRVALKVNAP